MTFGGTEGIWGQVGKLGQEEADLLAKAALDDGINLFDTANIYASGRSEQILGQSLRDLGVAQEDVVIATKVHGAMGEGPNRRGASRGHSIRNHARNRYSRLTRCASVQRGRVFDVPVSYSRDGYELTFATNCLGHFLLVELLADCMVDTGRIIFTASGTHDPDTMDGKMVGPVVEPDADMLVRIGKDGGEAVSAGKRYSTSK